MKLFLILSCFFYVLLHLCGSKTRNNKRTTMKWVLQLFGIKRKRTPLPPKPYIDTSSSKKHMIDPRLNQTGSLAEVDPEKPHWQDPRFDSRQSVPFFDLWGYNRDWSWTLFKIASFFFIAIFYWEMRTLASVTNNMPRVTSTTTVSPLPDYARDNQATEDELKAAGFAYISVDNLDNLGNVSSGS